MDPPVGVRTPIHIPKLRPAGTTILFLILATAIQGVAVAHGVTQGDQGLY